MKKIIPFQIFIILLLGLCLTGIIKILNDIPKSPAIKVREKITIVREKQIYFERMEINQRIQEIQSHEDYDKIIALYGDIAGNRETARLILNNSLVKRIPVNLAFALSKQESDFNANAINKNIKNGKTLSIDHGLFMLNSHTFRTQLKNHGIDWLLDPENNVNLGLIHLQQLYVEYGSYDMAVIRYNGRFDKGADEHLVNVYRYEREFDKLFNNL